MDSAFTISLIEAGAAVKLKKQMNVPLLLIELKNLFCPWLSTIDPSFPAIIPGIFVRKTGYSRAARGHSRTVTFGFDALLGLALSHVFYSPILCASVWFPY